MIEVDRQAPQGRRPRRQPDSLRALGLRLRPRVQPGHAHRRARRAGRPLRARGRDARRGRRRRRPQALPRPRPRPARACSAPASPPRPPPTTSSRPAAPASRRRSWSPTRSPSARSTPGSPAAPTPPPTPRSGSTRSCGRRCWRRTGSARPAGKLKALTRVRPGHVVPAIPRNEEPRTGLSMGEHCAIMATEWEIGRAEQDELTVESHQSPGRRLRARLPRRPDDALPRARARPEPAPRLRRPRSWRS